MGVKMAKPRITITFDNEETKDFFIGWFLDGGGEQTMNDSAEEELETTLDIKWDEDFNFKIGASNG